jgi:Tfp pilus assembly protein PilN
MIVPNLATRPHLNTRPVWLVTAVAGLLALIFAVANVRVWVNSNKELQEQLLRQGQLETEHERLATEVSDRVAELNRVPWRSLGARVNGVNTVIREHEFSWLGLLDDIERVLPYDVRLTKISPKVDVDSVSLSLMAVGRTRDALLDLLDRLISDPRFVEPTPASEITPEESGFGYVLHLSVTYLSPEPTP